MNKIEVTQGENIKPILTLFDEIINLSVSFKRKEFEYENETRLVKFSSQRLPPKRGRYGLTIFQKIKVPISLLKGIIISPFCNRKDIAKHAINELIINKLYPNTIPSEIPIKVEFSKLNDRL